MLTPGAAMVCATDRESEVSAQLLNEAKLSPPADGGKRCTCWHLHLHVQPNMQQWWRWGPHCSALVRMLLTNGQLTMQGCLCAGAQANLLTCKRMYADI